MRLVNFYFAELVHDVLFNMFLHRHNLSIFAQVLCNTNISVGPPFYNQVIAPILIPFLIFMAVGPKLMVKSKFITYKPFFIIIVLSLSN